MIWLWWMIPPNKPPEFHKKIASIELNMLESLPLQTRNLNEPLAFDPEGGLVAYRVSQKPKYGTLEIAQDETPITYIPNEGYSGLDDFQIKASDPKGDSSTQSYRVNIVDQCTGDVQEPFADIIPLFAAAKQCAIDHPDRLVSDKLNQSRPMYSCAKAKSIFGNEDLTERQLFERAKERAIAGDQVGALAAIDLCTCETPTTERNAYDLVRLTCWLRTKQPRLNLEEYKDKYPHRFLPRFQLPDFLQNPWK